MRVSVIIAARDEEFLQNTLLSLTNMVVKSLFEVIIIDDCSSNPVTIDSGFFPNVKVLRNKVQRGVGFCFDRGVSVAKGDIVVLMGSDVIVKDSSWILKVMKYVMDNPDSIGCSVCLSLDPEHLDPNKPANEKKRYGANLLPFLTTEDIPSDSEILKWNSYHIEIFEGQWRKDIPQDNVSEVPCIYGAFYFTTKQWYDAIHGWDFSHMRWGGLEPWISIKNWLYGGMCHVVHDLETGHIFEKSERMKPYKKTMENLAKNWTS